jgi:hypoxanthine-guanine phosphoribosyltransferase
MANLLKMAIRETIRTLHRRGWSQRRIADVPITYRGFHMPDVFAVGYGLDLYGRYRNLPYLGVLREEVFEPTGLA